MVLYALQIISAGADVFLMTYLVQRRVITCWTFPLMTCSHISTSAVLTGLKTEGQETQTTVSSWERLKIFITSVTACSHFTWLWALWHLTGKLFLTEKQLIEKMLSCFLLTKSFFYFCKPVHSSNQQLFLIKTEQRAKMVSGSLHATYTTISPWWLQ